MPGRSTGKKSGVILFLALVILLFAGSIFWFGKNRRNDSPRQSQAFHWKRFRGDDRNSGFAPGIVGPKDPNLQWMVKVENEVMSSPVIDNDGRVIIGSHDSRLYVISPRGHVLAWFETGEGIVSTPVLDKGHIWFGSMDGMVYKLRMDDISGDKLKLREEFRCHLGDWVVSSPAVARGMAFVSCRDGYLYGIDSSTGEVSWRTFIGPQRYEIQSSPAVNGNLIYVGSGQGGIYCIDTHGSLVWHYPAAGPVYASPALDQQGNIYFGDREGTLYSLSVNGSLRWKLDAGAPVTSSAGHGPGGEVVFCTTSGTIISLDRDSGKINWQYDTGSPMESSPALDGDGNIYAGTDGGRLVSIDSGGNLRWEYESRGPILSSPAIDSTGRIIFGCEDRHIYCLGDD